ncbi:Uncharacterised protein [Cedecea neteri]|uniref:Uncharacterized protein n=1 Tax=Cedecea neteri TaxID=158822 RepID=A0A2X3J8D4_9ENTR|nr:Uncharacterised protein [Cedecea neteri]
MSMAVIHWSRFAAIHICQLVPAHIHGNHRQRGNRHVRSHRLKQRSMVCVMAYEIIGIAAMMPAWAKEYRPDRVNTVYKLFAKAAFPA